MVEYLDCGELQFEAGRWKHDQARPSSRSLLLSSRLLAPQSLSDNICKASEGLFELKAFENGVDRSAHGQESQG